MAYYDALVTKWATLTPGTTQQKLTQLNANTVSVSVGSKILIPRNDVLNSIDPTDLASLTQIQVTQLTFILGSDLIDASVGSLARVGVQAIFTGKTTTLNALSSLLTLYSNTTVPWWQATVAQGGGGLTSPVNTNDLAAAGGLS